MKIFKYLCIVVIGILLNGCGVQPKPEVVTIIKTQIVKQPTLCTVPEIKCDFTGNGFTPTQKLLECVILQKKALESIGKEK